MFTANAVRPARASLLPRISRDLAVTTDFRAVLSELVSEHFGQNDLSAVFAGFRSGVLLGILRS